MIATWVVTVAFGLGASQPPHPLAEPAPVELIPVYKVPGPAFTMPCKLSDLSAVVGVQLWVSTDGAKTWAVCAEIATDATKFEFHAKRPGEHWFAVRLKHKDGTFNPASVSDLVPIQRVSVATGSEAESARKNRPTELANVLDEELPRLELELIRKEIKRLAEEKRLTPETEATIERLRFRLSMIRERSRGTTAGPEGLRATSPLPESTDSSIPPLVNQSQLLPEIPRAALPVAPRPRSPERPW
jgi:hypothetical protein